MMQRFSDYHNQGNYDKLKKHQYAARKFVVNVHIADNRKMRNCFNPRKRLCAHSMKIFSLLMTLNYILLIIFLPSMNKKLNSDMLFNPVNIREFNYQMNR